MKIAALAIATALAFGTLSMAPAQAQCCGEKPSSSIQKKEIDATLYIDIKGKRIFTCCKECLEKIKADPEKFIKDIEEGGVKFDSLENCHYYIEKSVDSPKWSFKNFHKIVTPVSMTLKDTASDNLPKVAGENSPKIEGSKRTIVVDVDSPKIIDPITKKIIDPTTPHIQEK